MSAYFYLIKVRILIAMAYRFEAISSTLVQFILLTVNGFFWKAVYRGNQLVQDTSLQQMLIYSVMGLLLSCFFSISTEHQLRSRIREGNIAIDFIKPVNLFGMYLANDIGDCIVSISQKGLPLVLFACIFIAVPVPASVTSGLLFLLSTLFSFSILWFIAAIFGLLNFWLIDIGPIGGAKDTILAFLSGSIIPIWFFPNFIQKILSLLPFPYIYQTPIGIYIGKIPLREALFSMTIQLVWIAVFFGLFCIIQKKAMNHLEIQGG